MIASIHTERLLKLHGRDKQTAAARTLTLSVNLWCVALPDAAVLRLSRIAGVIDSLMAR